MGTGWNTGKSYIELRLQRLTGMERDKIKEEMMSWSKLIAHLNELLSNETMRFDLIKTELNEIKQNSRWYKKKQKSPTSMMK